MDGSTGSMRIVVALGGNALLKRGEEMSAATQRGNVRVAAQSLARVADGNELVISHGNGPQVGWLALHAVDERSGVYPLDLLGAETEGMIGYLIEQELGNLLPFERPLASLLTMVEVDPEDPAFGRPTKFIGPIYGHEESGQLARDKGWTFRRDGQFYRRVVPSPRPKRIFEIRPIRWLLEKDTVVICLGGGGIPTMYDEDGKLRGVEGVIDKDRASELLAREIEADVLIMATDVEAVYRDWGTPDEEAIGRVHPDDLDPDGFPDGSMGPKVEAAKSFAERAGGRAAIGSLEQLADLVEGTAGTQVTQERPESS